jgi:hypothetical protein
MTVRAAKERRAQSCATPRSSIPQASSWFPFAVIPAVRRNGAPARLLGLVVNFLDYVGYDQRPGRGLGRVSP